MALYYLEVGEEEIVLFSILSDTNKHKELSQCLNHRNACIILLIPFLVQWAFYKVTFHF